VQFWFTKIRNFRYQDGSYRYYVIGDESYISKICCGWATQGHVIKTSMERTTFSYNSSRNTTTSWIQPSHCPTWVVVQYVLRLTVLKKSWMHGLDEKLLRVFIWFNFKRYNGPFRFLVEDVFFLMSSLSRVTLPLSDRINCEFVVERAR